MGSGTGGLSPRPNHCCFESNAHAPFPCTTPLHTCTVLPRFLPPAGPQPKPPPVPWVSAGSPADVSAPLRASNTCCLTLSSFQVLPQRESSHTDVLLLSRKQEQQPPPSPATHRVACTRVLPSSPLLARYPDPLSPPPLPGASAANPPRSCCLSVNFKAELCSRLQFAGQRREHQSLENAGGSGNGTVEINNAVPIDCKCCVSIAFPHKASSSLFLQGLPP